MPSKSRKPIHSQRPKKLMRGVTRKTAASEAVSGPKIMLQRAKKFVVLIGRRRLLAAHRANMPCILAIVDDFSDERHTTGMALASNLDRGQHDAIHLAEKLWAASPLRSVFECASAEARQRFIDEVLKYEPQ